MKPVVVVGAGPAGCSASIKLRQAGLPVVLVEAERFPRHRPGESLHPGVEPILGSLGVATKVNAAGFVRHKGHYVSWADDQQTFSSFGADSSGEWLGYQAWRPEFDQILLAEARELGVEVIQPQRVTSLLRLGDSLCGISTAMGEIRASFVLDASGRNHWLSSQLKIAWKKYSHRLTARYGYVDLANSKQSQPLMKRDATGWTWLAPIGSSRCSWVRLNIDGSDPGPYWVPPEFAGMDGVVKSRGADVTWRMAEQTAGQNWYLLGDAAAVLDPASSHGVLKALMSGIQAADLVVKTNRGEISQHAAAAYYRDWVSQWFLVDVEQLRSFYEWNTN